MKCCVFLLQDKAVAFKIFELGLKVDMSVIYYLFSDIFTPSYTDIFHSSGYFLSL